jgi:hypothetical protein
MISYLIERYEIFKKSTELQYIIMTQYYKITIKLTTT